jgi:hypothetical protein
MCAGGIGFGASLMPVVAVGDGSVLPCAPGVETNLEAALEPIIGSGGGLANLGDRSAGPGTVVAGDNRVGESGTSANSSINP